MGMIVGPLLAGVINAYLGWRWNFYICGSIPLVVTILWVFLVKDTPQENIWISPDELQFILNNIIIEEPDEAVSKIPPYKSIIFSVKVWAMVRIVKATTEIG